MWFQNPIHRTRGREAESRGGSRGRREERPGGTVHTYPDGCVAQMDYVSRTRQCCHGSAPVTSGWTPEMSALDQITLALVLAFEGSELWH